MTTVTDSQFRPSTVDPVASWRLTLGRLLPCARAYNQGVNEGIRLAIDRIRHFEVGEYNQTYRNRLIAYIAKELK